MDRRAKALSIIVPVYNVADYLDECVNSLISNEDDDIEIILVDDGSTDGSSELCDEIALKDKRVIVIHKKNGGVSSARNVGIEKSTGKWVCFVDSDDWVYYSILRMIHSRYFNSKCEIVSYSFEMERQGGSLVKSSESNETYTYEVSEYCDELYSLCLQNQMYWPNAVPKSTQYPVMTVCYNKLFLRKFLIENSIRFDEKTALNEDKIFNYECVNKANTIIFSDIIAYHYRYRDTSAVHSDGEKMLNQMNTTIHKLYEVVDDYPVIKNGAFAYSVIQNLWTLVDRLGKSSSEFGEISCKAIKMKAFMRDKIVKDALDTIKIKKIYRMKHKIIAFFLKKHVTYIPVLMCYLYHKRKSDTLMKQYL